MFRFQMRNTLVVSSLQEEKGQCRYWCPASWAAHLVVVSKLESSVTKSSCVRLCFAELLESWHTWSLWCWPSRSWTTATSGKHIQAELASCRPLLWAPWRNFLSWHLTGVSFFTALQGQDGKNSSSGENSDFHRVYWGPIPFFLSYYHSLTFPWVPTLACYFQIFSSMSSYIIQTYKYLMVHWKNYPYLFQV